PCGHEGGGAAAVAGRTPSHCRRKVAPMIAKAEGFVALNRFGSGAGLGDLDRVGGDARGWAQAQLDRGSQLPPELANLGGGEQQARTLLAAIQDKSIQREEFRQQMRALYLEEAGQRTLAAITSPTPLIERLVHFWSNPFTVSGAGQPSLAGLVARADQAARR